MIAIAKPTTALLIGLGLIGLGVRRWVRSDVSKPNQTVAMVFGVFGYSHDTCRMQRYKRRFWTLGYVTGRYIHTVSQPQRANLSVILNAMGALWWAIAKARPELRLEARFVIKRGYPRRPGCPSFEATPRLARGQRYRSGCPYRPQQSTDSFLCRWLCPKTPQSL